jgi:hypothetical protein
MIQALMEEKANAATEENEHLEARFVSSTFKRELNATPKRGCSQIKCGCIYLKKNNLLGPTYWGNNCAAAPNT